MKELLKYIELQTPEDAVFASSVLLKDYHDSFATSPLPNLIYFFTGRKILFQEWSVNTQLPVAEQIAREVLLNHLLSAQRIQDILKVDNYSDISLPGDLYFGTWTFLRLYKRAIWEELEKPGFVREVCIFLRNLKVDYIILEDPDLQNHKTIWSTPFKNYRVAAVDSDKFGRSLCNY